MRKRQVILTFLLYVCYINYMFCLCLVEVEVEQSDEKDKTKERSDERTENASGATRKKRAKPLEGMINPEMIAPEPKTVRNARGQISSYAIKGVAEELIYKGDGVLAGDGTSRSWIRSGKLYATPLHIGGRARRLPVLQLATETRDNLKDAIIHQLNQLAIASGSDKVTMWKQLLAWISDKAAENPGLMAQIAEELGCAHCPGEFFCLIHTVLGFDCGEAKVFVNIQKEIGVSKIFSNLNYVDFEGASFNIVTDSLTCIVKLISPQHSGRSWSRY